MKFEEQFPDLKLEGWKIKVNPVNNNEIWHIYEEFTLCNEDAFNGTFKDIFYDNKTIMKHCLSKQRVKEAIDKVSKMEIDYVGGMTFSKTLLKELGIEK